MFFSRAKVPVPGLNAVYPSGISDSLYQPRPASWYTAKLSAPAAKPAPEAIAQADSTSEQESASERYFME